MVRRHDLKTLPEPFAAVWVGAKTAELRRDDRGFEVNDVLRLKEFDPETGYSGRCIDVIVSHIVKAPGFGALVEGYVMLSFTVIGTHVSDPWAAT